MASSSNTRAARVDRSPESFESLRERNMAADTLQSYEKLSWASYARRESLQQTRLHYQNVVAGFNAADEAALVDWKTDNTPLPKRDDDGSRRKPGSNVGKGKEKSNGVVGGAQSASSSSLPESPGGKGKERSKESSKTGDPNSRKKRKSTGKT